jgi:hypothetical protein
LELAQYWHEAEPFIVKGLRADTIRTLGCVIDKLWNGLESLWVIRVDGRTCAAFVTGFYEGRLCMSNLGGSGVRIWLDYLLERLIDFARWNECEAVRCYGRKAWTRLFPCDCKVIAVSGANYLFERAV